jgi:uncharacterized protein (TIGR02444 family)
MFEPTGDLRRFALDVYASNGVRRAAILLQDRAGVDVNVLLLAAYVGAVRAMTFGDREMAAALARTGPWHADVVVPLRGVRTALKNGPPPAPSPATAKLRDQIKAAELDAEMLQLDELGELAARIDAPTADGPADSRAAAAMDVVVRTSACRTPRPDEHDAIAMIATAAALFNEGAPK